MEEKRIEDMTTEEIQNELERIAEDDGINLPDSKASGNGMSGIALAVGAVAAIAGGAILWVNHRKKKKAQAEQASEEEAVFDAEFEEVPTGKETKKPGKQSEEKEVKTE